MTRPSSWSSYRAALLLLALASIASAFVPPSLPRPSPIRQQQHQKQQLSQQGRVRPFRQTAPQMLLGRSGSGRFWGGSDDKQPQQPPAPPPLPGTTLVLEEPKSKARVYIVGCVHGARASEEDVAAVIEGRDAGVVVLELCESRYTAMRADEEKLAERERERAAASAAVVPAGSVAQDWAQGVSDFGASLQEFHRSYGLMQTALVALLSSSAAAQRFLQSGRACEFRRSVELAEARGAAVVLGDQDLSVTLTRFKAGWQGAPAWWPTLSAELQSIADAVLGPRALPKGQKVQVLPLLFTQGRYLRELLKVLVPVGAIVGLSLHAMEAVGDVALAWLQHLLQATPTGSLLPTAISLSDVADAAAGGVGGGGLDAALLTDLGWAAVNVFMLGWFLALNQVILVQRDKFLAESIAATCKQHPGARVAAVVGLLHGNGVARHLSSMGFSLVDRDE